jgi:hypothetical protein
MAPPAAKTRLAILCGLLTAFVFGSSPVEATIYSPPWADGMKAHFPGSGGLDTSNTINLAADGFDGLGYSGFSTTPSSIPASMGVAYAQSDAIWWMAGHGAAGVIQSYNSSTGVWGSLYVSSNAPTYSSCSSPNDCLTDYTSTLMHRIRLMVFQGCETADPTPNGSRLDARAYTNLGVDSSIGFTELIYFNSWSDQWSYFMTYYGANHNIADSLSMSASAIFAGAAQTYGYGNYHYYGGSVHLTPEAYGS